MECKAAGESVFAKEVLFEGNCEQAVDTELTLPDYCPDIGRLLKCRLVPMITSRQVNFDSLVVEGSARISVIYVDDRDKKVRCCDRDYPFKASVAYDGATDNVRLLAGARVDYVNCRAVSQRTHRSDGRTAVDNRHAGARDAAPQLVSQTFVDFFATGRGAQIYRYVFHPIQSFNSSAIRATISGSCDTISGQRRWKPGAFFLEVASRIRWSRTRPSRTGSQLAPSSQRLR